MPLPLIQPFENEWLTFVVFLIVILFILGLSEFFRIRLRWGTDLNRKWIHVVVGLIVACSPFIFKTNQQPIVLALIFILVNYYTLKYNIFKSMHATNRKTYGTVFFPLSFLILSIFFWEKQITLILSILLMTVPDAMATFVGENAKYPIKIKIWEEEKTLQGSAAMFISSFLIIYIGTDFFAWFFSATYFLPVEVLIGCGVFVGFLATLAEATSNKGSDNLSVPLVAAIAYELYLYNFTHGTLINLLFWTLVSAILLYTFFKLNFLNSNGFVGAFLMGIFIFGSGGFNWIIAMLVFFILSSIISKIGKKSDGITQKGSKRDIVQVFANGGVPMLIALINFFHPFNSALELFLGSVSAATADTCATEIGMMSAHSPRHILNFKKVEKGTSGGVTIMGFIGSFLGASLIAWVGELVIGGWLPVSGFVILLAGLIGSLVDSILGGSVQAMFTCTKCGEKTEKRIHCNIITNHSGGIKWLDNDGVNLINTAVGAILTLLMIYIL